MGENVIFLQLKKLEYLKLLGDEKMILCQYNYFIETSSRKERWHYKKAKFLYENERYFEALNCLENACQAYLQLPVRIQNTKANLLLMNGINELKTKINSHEILPKAENN